MNYKKISRSLICLLLVAALLVGVSPVRAEAVAASTFVLVSGLTVIASTLIGLGLAAGDNQDAFRELSHLISQQEFMLPYLDQDGNISIPRQELEDGKLSPWLIPASLVLAIRSWLFDSGTIQETVVVNTSGFSSPSLGTTKDNYGPYKSVSLLADAYPTELTCIIRDLGIMNKVAVFDIGNASSAYLIGLYWGADGRLMQGAFENPLGTAHASLYGVYSYSDLNLVDCCVSEFKNSSYSLSSGGIFYDKSYAEAMPDFQTSVYYAVDWTRDFSYGRASVTSSYCLSAKVFVKKASDATWASSLYSVYKDSAPDAYWGSYYISASDIVWDDATSTTFSVPEGLATGQIAPQAQDFLSGYPTWGQGQVVDEDDNYWFPIGLNQTLDETMGLTQEQVQLGQGSLGQEQDQEQEQTQTNGILQSFKDNVSTWFARVTLNLSNIFDELTQGFKAVISALANLPALIAGIFRTLASHFKSIFLLGTLLEVLFEFLQALFGWLPENMLAVLMLLFGVSAFYKFIGR